jgi:hypothetical protein
MTITREQAIEMAREAGAGFPAIYGKDMTKGATFYCLEDFERLCNLAAAHQAKQDEKLMRMALKFTEFLWREVGMNDYASNEMDVFMDALRNRLEGV